MSKKPELLEIRRQSAHLFFGFSLAVLLAEGFIDAFFMAGIFFIILAFGIWSKGVRIPVYFSFLEIFERKSDMKIFPGKGLLFFILGAFLATALFPAKIAVASILVLAFGDSVSHIFGRHFGHIKTPFHEKKHIEGSLFGIIISALAISFFVPPLHAIIASTVAMILEFPKIVIFGRRIDDNIIIPLSAGLTLYLLNVL